jgi:hypothetical protein
MHALWHRIESYLYLICVGSEEECRRHGPDRQIHGFEDPAPMVVDVDGHIAQRFHIGAMLMAAEVDSHHIPKPVNGIASCPPSPLSVRFCLRRG